MPLKRRLAEFVSEQVELGPQSWWLPFWFPSPREGHPQKMLAQLAREDCFGPPASPENGSRAGPRRGGFVQISGRARAVNGEGVGSIEYLAVAQKHVPTWHLGK